MIAIEFLFFSSFCASFLVRHALNSDLTHHIPVLIDNFATLSNVAKGYVQTNLMRDPVDIYLLVFILRNEIMLP